MNVKQEATSGLPAAVAQFDTMPASGFVSVKVAALVLGVSSGTVWRLVKSGAMERPTKIGHSTRFGVGALRRFMAGQPKTEAGTTKANLQRKPAAQVTQ